MALRLTNVDRKGFEGNYWKLTRAGINMVTGWFIARLALYKSAEDAAAGKEKMKEIAIEMKLDGDSCIEKGIPNGSTSPCDAMQKAVYAKIKTMTLDGVDFTQSDDV